MTVDDDANEPLGELIDEIANCLSSTIAWVLSDECDELSAAAELANDDHAVRLNELQQDFERFRAKVEAEGAASIVQSTRILDQAVHLVRFAHEFLRSRSHNASNPMSTAISELLFQSIRVTDEINALLRAGFPDGAIARSRTLIELATTLTVISMGNRHTANRWLRHMSYQRAQQVAAIPMDHPEMNDALLAEAKREHSQAVRSYGKSFKEPYGWAHEIVGRKLRRTSPKWNPKFAELMTVAGFDRFAAFVRHSSNFVHADSFGVAKAHSDGASEVRFRSSPHLVSVVVDALLTSVWFASTAVNQTGDAELEFDAFRALVDEFRVDLMIESRRLYPMADQRRHQDRIAAELFPEGTIE